MLLKIFLFGLFLSVSFNCSSNEPKEIKRGVYFWKTDFRLDEKEKVWIDQNKIRKLYIRFFDVDWNPQINSAVPVGNVSITTRDLKTIEIIPVVFITNRTFKNIPDSIVPDLASNIHKKISAKFSLFDSNSISEIQIDCDWTQSTRNKYFLLLELLEKSYAVDHIEITATIRLHQVKYARETGIPPVKSGALMFYNMSDVSNIRTKNSIYDENIAKNYLTNFSSYPLHLDVILPAFSWVCLFRHSKLVNLINDVNERELEQSPEFNRLNENYFVVRQTGRLKGVSFLKGDYIRIEHITPGITLKAAELLSAYLHNKKFTLSLYNLNNELIKNYENENVEEIFSAFN